jgi:hypothetical protein
LADADGDCDDAEGPGLVGFAEVGLALLDAPHAATDSAVAPVTANSATRDSRAVEIVAGIGVLSIVVRSAALATIFTIGGAAERRLVPD